MREVLPDWPVHALPESLIQSGSASMNINYILTAKLQHGIGGWDRVFIRNMLAFPVFRNVWKLEVNFECVVVPIISFRPLK